MSDFELYYELFGLSFWASLAVGAVLPLVGALLFLRREAFLGVAVPQFSAAGLAGGLWLLPLFPAATAEFLEHGHPPMLYMLPFASGGALLALAAFGRPAGGRPAPAPEGRLAGGFALAVALELVFLARAPAGANLAETLLRGEILLLDIHGFEALLATTLAVLMFLVACRRTVLLSAFDPEQSAALGQPRVAIERGLLLATGLAVGAGVMTVGPVLVFGLLFLPPLAARALAPRLGAFLTLVLVFGLLSVLLAWPASLLLDLPYGPAVALMAAVTWGVAELARRLLRSAPRARAATR